jgi:hypothetical protein
MRARRQVSSALAALASGTSPVRWTVQVDSPGDSRRDQSDYLQLASSGTSDASDMWSAIGRQPALSRLVLAGQHAVELDP